MAEVRHTLFVYGTLRPRCRHPMAAYLAERGKHCGEAVVGGQLYDLGRYPAAVRSVAADEWVFGDLFEIDEITLGELDRYETEESTSATYYARRLDPVFRLDGGATIAWIYWFHGPLPPHATRIASGQYAKNFASADIQ